MATISLQGNEIHTSGKIPAVGTAAPDFVLVNKDLENISLAEFKGKRKLISIVPSLDTPVCATSTKKFNEAIEKLEDSVCIIVSADLPFAMSRFCDVESQTYITPLSMMRTRQFAKDYGVLIEDGPLAGITARAIVVLDKADVVKYAELVDEISNEPDYDKALLALEEA